MKEKTKESYIFGLGRHRILSLYEQAEEIYRGGMPWPKMAIIYPNYGCNNDCVGCEYKEDNKESAQLEENRLKRLLEELKEGGARSVEFCGGGEPTLYPGLERVIKHGRALGLNFGLLTNGTNIRGGLEKTLAEELSYVRVSLNAAAPETYKKTHRPRAGASFEDVTDNIRSLIAARDEIKSSLLVSVKMLVSSENMSEIPAMFELVASLGADSLQFKALRLDAGELSSDDAKLAAGMIRELSAARPNMMVVCGVEKVLVERKCWLNPVQTMIDARGDVYLCCYYRFRKDTHRIGNIYKSNFRAIWESSEHREAIEGIKPDECNLLDCRFAGYMEFLDEMLTDKGRQIEFF